MLISAKEIASFLNGEILGNPDAQVHSPSKIEEGKEGTISFLANAKYEHYAYTTNSTILLVSSDFVPTKLIKSTMIKVNDVYASVAKLMEKFGQIEIKNQEISPLAWG